MRILDGEQVRKALDWRELIEALRCGFGDPVTAPPRSVHTIELDGGDSAALLMMPAWRAEDTIGVKLVTLFARNSQRGLPGIDGLYVVFDGKTGQARAAMDGAELTARRTAAASALAADYLARSDARVHLMLGTGRLSLNVPLAMAAVRPIERFLVWGRRRQEAEARAAELRALGLDASAVASVAEGLKTADIVSAATNATAPLILGRDLEAGTHVDLIGAYTPRMRESDDEVMRRAAVIVTDTHEGADEEAGDIIQAIASGSITRASVASDLAGLCAGAHPGRRGAEEITVFKSCGCALEDLVAGRLALERSEPSIAR
ncbi:MAG: ornithine cyclodeaminase family protein [Rhizobiales bacterium]|nr:ornithine cyclodeaminase family protein [Hyphomicrobiales bacterium]